MMHNKIISFSLYGDQRKYTEGAVENARLANIYYPDWLVIFYTSERISPEIINTLNSEGANVIRMAFPENSSAMLWRWLPFLNLDNDYVIVRDCDSRLNAREKSAVEDWILSDKSLHIMRDHPLHTAAVMGGMWGARVKDVAPLLTFLKKNDEILRIDYGYGYDQLLLESKIFAVLKNSVYCNDEFTLLTEDRKPFKIKLPGNAFVGEVIENDRGPNLNHAKIRKDFQLFKLTRFKLYLKTYLKRVILSIRYSAFLEKR